MMSPGTKEVSVDPMRIAEHMPVFSSDGEHLGTVDKVEGETIKLTKMDQPNGQHHSIPVSWVQQVDDHVHLARSGGQVRQAWTANGAD